MKSTNRQDRPFVFINMAMTADGKIATANRSISSFGSRRDHEHLLELRATADAVLAGARTVDSNPINLGPGPARFRRLREQRGLREYNLRIIASRSGTVSAKAEIFKHRFSPILILTTGRTRANVRRRLSEIAQEVRVCGRREINFLNALRWLRRTWGVNRLLCEGGGELNDALVRAGVVDELHLTICPTVIGGQRAPTIADGEGAVKLATATRFKLKSARRHQAELFLVFERDPA